MPEDKLPIPQFAAKIKAKYPEYKDVNDTLLVQKIVDKYPEYKERVDLSGINEPVKKKVGLGDAIGGFASYLQNTPFKSVAQSASEKEPDVLAGVKTYTPTKDQLLQEHQVEIDYKDPVGSVISPMLQRKREIFNQNIGVESTGQNKVNKQVASNEVNNINETVDVLKKSVFPNASMAQQWRDRNPHTSEDNVTAKLADDVILDNKKVQMALQDNGGDISKAALQYYRAFDNPLAEKLLTLNRDGLTPPEEMWGNLVNSFLQNKNVQEWAKKSQENHNALKTQEAELYQRFPDLHRQKLLTDYADAREKMGENNWFYNNPASNMEGVVNKLVEEGKWSRFDKDAFIKNAAAGVATGYYDVPTPGIIENIKKVTGESIMDLPKTLAELSGVRHLYKSNGELLNEALKEDYSKAGTPNYGLGHQISNATANLLGVVIPMTGEAKALQGLNLVKDATLANEIATGLTFYHDIQKKALEDNPDNPEMAHLSALIQSAIWMKGAKVLPQLSQDAVKSLSPEINEVLNGLKTNTINNATAAKKIASIVVNGLGESVSTSSKVAGTVALNDAINGILSNKFDLDQTIQDAGGTFKSLMLGTPLLSFTKSFRESNVTRDIVNDAAANPELYQHHIDKLAETDPKLAQELSQNLEAATKIKSELDNREDLSESQKKRYLLPALREFMLKNKAEQIPNEKLREPVEKEIEAAKKEQEQILNESPQKEPETESKGITEVQPNEISKPIELSTELPEGYVAPEVNKQEFEVNLPENKGEEITPDEVATKSRNEELVKAFPNALELDENGNLVERGVKEGESEFAAMGRGILGYNEQYWEAIKNNTNPKELDSDKLNFLKEKYREGKINSLVDVFTWGNKKGREIHEKYDKLISENKPKEPAQQSLPNIEAPKIEQQGIEEGTPAPATETTNTNTSTNIGEGEQPPTTPPKEEGKFDDVGNLSGITHEQTEQTRKEFGLGEPYEKTPTTEKELNAKADEAIKGGYNIDKLLGQLESGVLPNGVETVILKKYKASLEAEIIKDPSDENLSRLKRLVKASDAAGSGQGLGLWARKGFDLRDDSLAGFFTTEQDVNLGAPLTEKQKETVKNEWEQIKDAKAKFEEYVAKKEEELSKKQAELAVQKAKSTRTKSKKTHQDHVEYRKKVIDDIHEKLKKVRTESNVTVVPYAKELFVIAPDVARLVKDLVEEGVTKLSDIVEEVHGKLKDAIPGIQKKDIHDIIAGEYNEKKATKNELAKKVFELKQQAKLMNKLDLLLKGETPKSEKGKIKRNQDVEAIRKQIKDIQGFDKEVERIKNESVSNNAYKNKEIAKQLDVAESELNKKEQNDKKAAELEAKKLDKEAAYRTPEEIAIDNAKKRMAKQISELESELPTAEEPIKKQPLILDKEGRELKQKLVNAKRDREIRLLKQEYENRSRYKKATDWVIDKLNIPRTIMASMDYSAPLRQGIVAAVAHPRTAGLAQIASFKASFSPKYFDNWFYDIKETPRYETAMNSELALADPHSPFLTAKEEAFMNNTAEKIPVIGKLIQGSERAYVMFLNKMRWDLFNRFADRMEERGMTYDNSPKEYKKLAEYINNQTGRGSLNRNIESAAPILNTLFFAPRLIASRLNLLNPTYYYKLPLELRVMAVKDLLKFFGLGVTVLALAKLNGAQVEDDPRSSDFGKIKQGNTRWDIWGGFQQYFRLLAQLGFGERKSTTTGEIKKLDGKGAFGTDRTDVLKTFVRGKLAPVPSMAADLFSGRTTTGDKVTLKDEAKSHLLPLLYSDIKQSVDDRGVKSLFDVGIPAIFGVGVQTYNPPPPKKQTKKYH